MLDSESNYHSFGEWTCYRVGGNNCLLETIYRSLVTAWDADTETTGHTAEGINLWTRKRLKKGIIAAAAMNFSSVSVVGNALQLKRVDI